ncbi:hypothetical protein J4E80_008880 [Alternaria sp. BMP 0032]|nr:hypothetical protein J4E80_008880 [Alternaria sp. BMP 0032]
MSDDDTDASMWSTPNNSSFATTIPSTMTDQEPPPSAQPPRPVSNSDLYEDELGMVTYDTRAGRSIVRPKSSTIKREASAIPTSAQPPPPGSPDTPERATYIKKRKAKGDINDLIYKHKRVTRQSTLTGHMFKRTVVIDTNDKTHVQIDLVKDGSIPWVSPRMPTSAPHVW